MKCDHDWLVKPKTSSWAGVGGDLRLLLTSFLASMSTDEHLAFVADTDELHANKLATAQRYQAVDGSKAIDGTPPRGNAELQHENRRVHVLVELWTRGAHTDTRQRQVNDDPLHQEVGERVGNGHEAFRGLASGLTAIAEILEWHGADSSMG